MKFNKVITVVVLTLSFCIFDQMKNRLVEKTGTTNANLNPDTLNSSVDKIRHMIPVNITLSTTASCEDGNVVNDGAPVFIDLGENICKTVLLLEF